MKNLYFLIVVILSYCFTSCSPTDKTSRALSKSYFAVNKKIDLKISGINKDVFYVLIVNQQNQSFGLVESNVVNVNGHLSPDKRPYKFYSGSFIKKEDSLLLRYNLNRKPLYMKDFIVERSNSTFSFLYNNGMDSIILKRREENF